MDIGSSFESLSTPLIADACVRLDIAPRIAPPGIRAAFAGCRAAGRVRPAAHAGSVDVFLEAFESASPGDVLVVDNAGRLDEGCVGDLTALEARTAGVCGIVIWGAHRDTAELTEVGLPVFSYGAWPAGPLRVAPRPPESLRVARFGVHEVGPEDAVFADTDGVVFVDLERTAEVLQTASTIRATEQHQARAVSSGTSLREQLRFREYLERRSREPGYSFRLHLRSIGGAIEE